MVLSSDKFTICISLIFKGLAQRELEDFDTRALPIDLLRQVRPLFCSDLLFDMKYKWIGKCVKGI